MDKTEEKKESRGIKKGRRQGEIEEFRKLPNTIFYKFQFKPFAKINSSEAIPACLASNNQLSFRPPKYVVLNPIL